MFLCKVGDYTIRTGAVEGGRVETRITRGGKLHRRSQWATAVDALCGHVAAVRDVEAMVALEAA